MKSWSLTLQEKKCLATSQITVDINKKKYTKHKINLTHFYKTTD